MNHSSVKELITTVLHAVSFRLCTLATQYNLQRRGSGVVRGGRVMLPPPFGTLQRRRQNVYFELKHLVFYGYQILHYRGTWNERQQMTANLLFSL